MAYIDFRQISALLSYIFRFDSNSVFNIQWILKGFWFRLVWNVQQVDGLVYAPWVWETWSFMSNFFVHHSNLICFLKGAFNLVLILSGESVGCRHLNSTSNESACVVKALCGCIVSLHPAYILAMHWPLNHLLLTENLYNQLKY